MSAKKVLTVLDIVMVCTSRVSDGADSATKMAATVRTTISSSNVKPPSLLPIQLGMTKHEWQGAATMCRGKLEVNVTIFGKMK